MAAIRKKSAPARKKSANQNLARYRAKRSFDITAEPSGGKPTAEGNSFVVQKHAARRLHYDFRLELDGVLLSWAMPRGPSLDPADKRLAAHVEDHPTDYGGFEGTIPQGQYGGGTVMLWDRGTWEPQAGEEPHEGYRKGRLKFILHGERMKGGWTLVRMGPRGQERNSDNWLLIKERDSEARPGEGTLLVDKGMKSIASGRTMEQIADAPDRDVWHSNRAEEEKPKAKKSAKKSVAATASRAAGVKRGPLPDFVPPTLATLVDRPPSGDQWLHEIKVDGYRIFARRRNGKVVLLTRNALDWTGRFKPIAEAVAKLPGGDLALDGEIAVLDQNGGSSFAALQDALSRGDTKPMRYIVFDLLYRDGEDWRGAKLTDRKDALRDLLKNSRGPLVYSDHVVAHGGEVFQQACNLALEGVISKRADMPYFEGRTRDWLKTKCTMRQEFVITGYVDSNAHRGIGALALGYYEDEKLRYAGRVGTGFDHRTALDLAKRLKPMVIDRVPFADLPNAARRGVHWVEPELVCEIAFLNWTPDGVLRHPSFQGLREDKPAKSVKRERAVPTDKADREGIGERRSAARSGGGANPRAQRSREDRRRDDLASRSRHLPRSRHHQAPAHRILCWRRRLDHAAHREPAAQPAALSRRHRRRMLLPEAFRDRHERHQARHDQREIQNQRLSRAARQAGSRAADPGRRRRDPSLGRDGRRSRALPINSSSISIRRLACPSPPSSMPQRRCAIISRR